MRIPIFAMIWGVRMCEFCCKIGKLEKSSKELLKADIIQKKMKHKLLNLKVHFIYSSDAATLLCLESESKT